MALLRPAKAWDRYVEWQQTGQGRAGFYSGIDGCNGTVRCMGSGVWNGRDADLYYEQQRRIVEEARRRYGPLRVFFDVRDWVVEGPQSALLFTDMNAEIYRPEDRLVAVVKSSALKEHPRTALGDGNREAFISMSAAETWLQAYADPKR